MTPWPSCIDRPSGHNALAIGRAISMSPCHYVTTYMFAVGSIKEPTPIWPDKIAKVKEEFDLHRRDAREQFIADYLTALITR